MITLDVQSMEAEEQARDTALIGQPNKAQAALEYDQALKYVLNVKKRFANDHTKNRALLNILQSYQEEQLSIKQVCVQVCHLFQDDLDLIKGIARFLPDFAQTPAKEQVGALNKEARARKQDSEARVGDVPESPADKSERQPASKNSNTFRETIGTTSNMARFRMITFGVVDAYGPCRGTVFTRRYCSVFC